MLALLLRPQHTMIPQSSDLAHLNRPLQQSKCTRQLRNILVKPRACFEDKTTIIAWGLDIVVRPKTVWDLDIAVKKPPELDRQHRDGASALSPVWILG